MIGVCRRHTVEELRELVERVVNGEEPSVALVERVLREAPLHELVEAADWLRRVAVGDRGSYVANVYIAYTNVCVARCPICNFYAKSPGEAYTLSPGEVEAVAARFRREKGVTEAHVTGGLDPRLTPDYYAEIVSRLKRLGLTVKAFTAEEIDFVARTHGESVETLLAELREAGLDAMPGGGAEVLSKRVRGIVAPAKMSVERYLEVHRVAHRLGIKSNVTMLYGHVEEPAEVARHLLLVRRLQRETGGLISFIPLRWNPGGTALARDPRYRRVIEEKATPLYDLRIVAVSRITLYPLVRHIVAYWVAMGVELASIALRAGADDLGGTFYNEHVVAAARGEGRTRGLDPEQLEFIIAQAGLEPCERDTFYRCLGRRSEGMRHWETQAWVQWRPST